MSRLIPKIEDESVQVTDVEIAGFDEPALVGEHHDLGSVAQAELAETVRRDLGLAVVLASLSSLTHHTLAPPLTVALGRCDDWQMAAYTDTEPSRCGSTSSRQDLMLDRHNG